MSLLDIAKQVEADIKAREHARGITTADVLRIFPGFKVHNPDQVTLPCTHCGGKMTDRLERRRHVLACHHCRRRKG